MKKTLTLLLLIGITLYGIYFLRSAMPFMPVYGISMEPVLHSGDLITIKPVAPAEIKEGDIIVYNVPLSIQEHYNYPPVVAHRVTKVNHIGRLSFRTKGDNTGDDPFTILASDVRGVVGGQYANLGLPFLFLQSRWGFIFAMACLALTALFTYSSELGRSGGWAHQRLLSPVIRENRRAAQSLGQRMKSTEEGITSTQQTLTKFSDAVALYGQHLQSHTSAIMGLSEASQELKRGAAEQNRILGMIADTMKGSTTRREEPQAVKPPATKPQPRPEPPPAPRAETRPPPASKKQAVSRQPKPIKMDETALKRLVKEQQQVPGCLRNRR
ncbi:MAG: signal peptidase I [Chloroflexota bacterium]